jgi:hypothetical protein
VFLKISVLASLFNSVVVKYLERTGGGFGKDPSSRFVVRFSVSETPFNGVDGAHARLGFEIMCIVLFSP